MVGVGVSLPESVLVRFDTPIAETKPAFRDRSEFIRDVVARALDGFSDKNLQKERGKAVIESILSRSTRNAGWHADILKTIARAKEELGEKFVLASLLQMMLDELEPAEDSEAARSS
jgi:metal-responsive CopG/Arc/MetJ family transcriptional regulator